MPAEHVEVPVGDLGDGAHRDGGAGVSSSATSRSRASGISSSASKGTPPSPTSSGWPPLVAEDGREPACERLEERVRARIVAARREVDVVLAEEAGDLLGRRPGRRRRRCSNARCVRPTNVSSYRSWSRCRSSQASVSAPFRALSDQLDAMTRTRRPVERRRVLPADGRWPGRPRSR